MSTTNILIQKGARPPRISPSVGRYLAALRTPRAIFGAAVIIVLVALALLTPVLFPGGYDQQTGDSFLAPSLAHPFGTDELGRDLFVRSLYGLRADLSIVFVAVPISMVVGTGLGLIGAVSPFLGAVVQRILDVILGFPGVILGVCIVLVLGPGWLALVIAIAVSGLPSFGRQARAALVEQSQREYVTAARTLGVGRGTILVRHILPNAVDPILVQGAVYVVYAVFIEAGLSIIGLGIQPPQPSLGALLNTGIRFITQAPFYIVGPTAVLILLALAFSVLADALNDSVNRK